MLKHELTDKLQRLDPGATLTVEESVLAEMFGASTLSDEIVQAIEAFALERRCTFSYHERGLTAPCFEKDDIF
jgi:hypothetical protein